LAVTVPEDPVLRVLRVLTAYRLFIIAYVLHLVGVALLVLLA
jgi:hypothetical protein